MLAIQFSIAAAVIILVVILIIVRLFKKPNIRGWWDAPKKFCAKAGIKSASLYFADDVSICIDENEYLCSYTVKNGKIYIEDSPLPEVLRMEVKDGLMLLYDENDVLHMELYRNNMLSDGCI